MLNKFIYTLLPALLVLAGNTSLASNTSEITAAFAGKKVLALGEMSHEQEWILSYVRSVIRDQKYEIDWIGIEVESDMQKTIDLYLVTANDSEPKLKPHVRGLLDEVVRSNHLRAVLGKNPIKVIALDLPSEGIDVEGDWFFKRDQFMFDTLAQATDGFAGRGILYMGMGHLSKESFRLPRLASLHLGKAGDLETLGNKLENVPALQNEIVRVGLHQDIPWVERFGMLPPDYISLFKFLGRTDGVTATASAEFSKRELSADPRGTFPINLSRNLDYIVRLDGKISVGKQCETLLENKALILRGIIFRALDLLARFKK